MNMTQASQAETRIRRLHFAAALVGHFDPSTFGESFITDDERQAALTTLVELCREVNIDGLYLWSMNPDARRDLLGQLREFPGYQELLADTQPAAGDDFGVYLISGLQGENLAAKASGATDEVALLRAARQVEAAFGGQATGAASTAPGGSSGGASRFDSGADSGIAAGIAADGLAANAMAKDDPVRQIRQHIARGEAQLILQSAIPEELFGRSREYRRLLQYCTIPVRQPVHGPLILLLITGVGGVGKSALVSQFIYRQRQREDKPPVVYFDFDRASLAQADPMDLTFELSRQIGLFDSSMDVALSRFRQQQREVNPTTSDFESGSRAFVGAMSDLRALFAGWKFRDEPIVL